MAVNDAYSVIEHVPFSATGQGGVLANVVIASGNALSVTANTTTAHGALVMNSGGTFTYSPVAG